VSLEEKIIELYNKGYTYKEISKSLGINFGSLCYIISYLHKVGKISYRPVLKKIYLPIIEDFIKTNPVFSIGDVMNYLNKNNIKISRTAINNKLLNMYYKGIIKKIDVANLKKFSNKHSPKVLYYTDYQSLIEYIVKRIKVNNNDIRSFRMRVYRLPLPDSIKKELIKNVL